MLGELKVYATCFVSFFVIDLIWIGVIMKSFYIEQLRPIGRITGDKFEPVIWAAAAVYVVLAIGVVNLVLPRISSDTSWLATWGYGALLGFVIYATYDLTNYSTLKDYTLLVTFADMVWGTVLGGVVTCIARYVRDL